MNRRTAWIGAAGAGLVLLRGLAILFGRIRLLTQPEIREVTRFTHPDGRCTVVFQAVGQPQWPFVSTPVRILCLDETGAVWKTLDASIRDDGAAACDRQIAVIWLEDAVRITLMGSEQPDAVYVLPYISAESACMAQKSPGQNDGRGILISGSRSALGISAGRAIPAWEKTGRAHGWLGPDTARAASVRPPRHRGSHYPRSTGHRPPGCYRAAGPQ